MKKFIAGMIILSLLVSSVAMTVAISEEIDIAVGIGAPTDEVELELDDEIEPVFLDDDISVDLTGDMLVGDDATDQEALSTSAASTTTASNHSEINVGPESDSESIRYVQDMLVAVCALPARNVNGVYDDATRTAVAAFQRWVNEEQNGTVLDVTGLVDNQTRLALEYAYDHGYTITGDVVISENSFPDDAFRAYVSEECDTNGDGYLSKSEINAVTEIGVEGIGITDLTGIEHFTKLTYLNCSDNQILSINISNNAKLEDFNCGDNRLTSLDLSHNTELEYFGCINNPLQTLDVSFNPKLIDALKTEVPYRYNGHLIIIPKTAMDDTDQIYLAVDGSITIKANGETLYSPNMTLKRTGPSTVIGFKESCDVIEAITVNGRRPYYITVLNFEKCKFKSSDPKTVKVNSKGTITGLKKGKANITISRGGISVSCPVQVKKAPSKVKLSKTKLKMAVGDIKDLKAKVPSGSASRIFTWSSSDEKVASFSDWYGAVEAVGPGTATITVKTYNGKKATCKVTVTAPEPTTLDLNTTGLYLEVGKTFQIVPTIDEGTSTTFTYTSKNKRIASVSKKGLVKGIKAGTTAITVSTKNGLKKTFEVQVGNKGTYKSGTSGVKVFASLSDAYYHGNSNCTQIVGTISRVTLETALNYGKKPCPDCLASAVKTVYVVKGGKYYHTLKSHAGSSAKKCTLAAALAYGYKACPECVE